MSEAEVEKRSQIAITVFLVMFWGLLIWLGAGLILVFVEMQGTYALIAIDNGTWTGPEATNTYNLCKTIANMTPLTALLIGSAGCAFIIYKRRHTYAA